MKRITRWSIRAHLLLLVGLAVLPALCILLYTGLEQQREAGSRARQVSVRQAFHLAELQEGSLVGTRQLLSVLAEVPQIRDRNGPAGTAIFKKLVEQNPRYDNLLAALPDGRIYASAFGTRPATVIADRRYFMEAVRTGQFAVGEFVIGRSSGKPTLHFALPLLDSEGRLQQVLAAGLDMSNFDEIFDQVTLPPGASFVLLDHRGRILHAVPELPAGNGNPYPGWEELSRYARMPVGTLVNTDTQGVSTHYAYQNLGLPGLSKPYMTILVGIPQQSSIAAARWILWRNILLLAVATLVAAAGALALGNAGIVVPIQRLAEATRRMAEGRTRLGAQLEHAPQEIGQLAKAFDHMTVLSGTREADRLRAAESLRLSEERYRAIVANAPLGIFHFDDHGVLQDFNGVFLAMLGSSRAALSGWDMVAGLQDENLRQAVLEALGGRHGFFEGPYTSITGTNKVLVRVLTYGIASGDGRSLGGVGIVEDVSQRHKADQALRESESRYQGLFQNSPDCIFWIQVQGDGRFTVDSINPAQEAASGLPAAAMVGKPLQAFLPAAQAEALVANYQRCLRKGRSVTYEDRDETRPGGLIHQTLLIPIRNPEGRIHRLVGISRDITQRRLSEDALRQSQKLESLGVLAGGIAHDFNNLLTAILGNLDLALFKLPADSPAVPFLDNAEKTSLKASELTKQMLAYSGKGHFVIKPHDLNQLVQEMTHLLQVSISKKALLRYHLGEDLPPIEADSAQIQQVVMNLVTNASEAIEDRDGVISISTGVVELDAATLRSRFPGHSMAAGRYVVLEVADTGCGMGPEVQARIFDPFYTTKMSGRGLGLSAMLGILRGHGAGIKIHSEAGCGSSFRIFLPSSTRPALPETISAPQAEGALQGTVLLVDDEIIILDTLAPALEAMGFQVITARDGQEAVDLYRQGNASIDLVLMDLTMPRMDGREAFQAMRQIRKDARVILTSGYNEQESLQHFIGKGLAGFIQKPFLLKTLRAVIQANLTENVPA